MKWIAVKFTKQLDLSGLPPVSPEDVSKLSELFKVTFEKQILALLQVPPEVLNGSSCFSSFYGTRGNLSPEEALTCITGKRFDGPKPWIGRWVKRTPNPVAVPFQ